MRLGCAPAPDGQIQFTVSDDGEGIPPDQLDAIFDRFHRVDGARTSSDGSGSGLGLTIARAITADHGGTLTAASAGRDAGTTMTLRLPAASQERPAPTGPPRGRE